MEMLFRFFRIQSVNWRVEKEKRRGTEESVIFTRVRTSEGVDRETFKLTVVAPLCYPGIYTLNGGRIKEKIAHVSQRVHEIFFSQPVYYFCYCFNMNKICTELRT